MPDAPFFEIMLILPDAALPFFEEALENTADSLLITPLETGLNAGKKQLQALFMQRPDSSALRPILEKAAREAGIPPPDFAVAEQPARNWLKESYQGFPPILIGKYFIYGSHLAPAIPAGAVSLQLDAATAFGTGEHPTTRGCLMALNDLAEIPLPALDVGCGSGILALAVAKQLNQRADAVDIDPESVAMTRKNALKNNLENLISVWQSDGCQAVSGTYRLILSNILAQPLIDQAPQLASHLQAGGLALLSGFLQTQEEAVWQAYQPLGFTRLTRYPVGEWSTLVLRKEAS